MAAPVLEILPNVLNTSADTDYMGEVPVGTGSDALTQSTLPIVKDRSLESQTSVPSAEDVAYMRTCVELGKFARQGCAVLSYSVEGRQSFCSPVRGVIKAVLYDASNDEFVEDVTLHPTRAREAINDLGGLLDHLNQLADTDRAIRAASVPKTWHHDK